jgi:uncharacterized membrane protein YhhN
MRRETTMTALAFLLLSLTAVVAVGDWLAVANNYRVAEYLLKPLVMVFLIAVTLSIDPSSDFARVMLVIGLVLSMIGDIALMLPKNLFVVGLGAFLIAHVFYVIALLSLGISLTGFVVGVVLTTVVAVVQGAARTDKTMAGPVAAYISVISLMVAAAIGTGQFFAISGALLFGASDAVLGWTRFLNDFPRSRIIVMVTYHLGQAGLVLALL